MALTPGTRLGPYEIVSAVGAGAMGEVYKAVDTRLGRTVAIKTVSSLHAQRFQQEARAIAALNHPHICVLHDVGADYLVMEYVEGTPLQGPLSLEESIRVASDLVDALEVAHAKGILHRDLKPSNILLTSSGVKLLDFGLAKIADDPTDDATRTAAGTVLGTAAYMSPEQAEGRPADARSDIFSLGAVLYEVLSGRRAFARQSVLATLNAVVHDEPPPLASSAGDVVKRCLAKLPSDRFQTMAEVKAALRQLRTLKPGPAQDRPSIAVLPFANLSRDADDEYFSDGLAGDIIIALSQVSGLKVIARTSAFAFKGKNEDVRRISEMLGVTHLLEGSVRRAGNRLRVTAQLIQAAEGTHLWSERYDREMSDVFAVQDEIASSIAAALKLKLTAPSARLMPSLPAYEAYLRYRSYQWQFTPEASQRSRECLEQAIALDPDFALPYVGLADYHFALASVGGMPASRAMPRARELAARALQIDPDLPEAHAMLGIVAGQYDHDWREAERRFDIAVAREPLTPHLRQWYGTFLLCSIGRKEAAEVQVTRVIEDDPFSQMWLLMRAQVFAALGLVERAIADIRKAVTIDPGFWLGWVDLGMLYASRGQHIEAMPCAQKAIAAAPWCPYCVGLMAAELAVSGDMNGAAQLLDQAKRDVDNEPVALAMYHIAQGEIEEAIAAAVVAVEQRFQSFIPRVLRHYEPLLRQSPSWSKLLKAANLPQSG